MLPKIIGFFWIALGIWWLLRPQSFKQRLQRKMTRRFKRTVLVFLFVFAGSMFLSSFKTEGVPAKLVIIIGLLIGIRLVMTLMGHGTDKFVAWWGERPIIIFRVLAGLFLLFGLWLFLS